MTYCFPLTEVVDDHRPAPTENQVISMENFLPTRTQQVTILQPFVSVYIAQHENCDISKKSYKSIHKPSKVLMWLSHVFLYCYKGTTGIFFKFQDF